jgi:hypothetical protein
MSVFHRGQKLNRCAASCDRKHDAGAEGGGVPYEFAPDQRNTGQCHDRQTGKYGHGMMSGNQR